MEHNRSAGFRVSKATIKINTFARMQCCAGEGVKVENLSQETFVGTLTDILLGNEITYSKRKHAKHSLYQLECGSER